MTKHEKGVRAGVLLCGATVALVAADFASARPTQIDFGSDLDAFESQGAMWPENSFLDGVDLTNEGTSSGVLPFNLLVGTTSYTNYCMVENGFVRFSTVADPCAATATDVLEFSVLADAWDTFYDGSATNQGTTSITDGGIIDRDLDGDGTYELAEADPAMRFLWSGVTPTGGTGDLFWFQIMLYDLDGGDFDVEFNYGAPGDFAAAYDLLSQQRIVQNGTSLFDGAGPFLAATDYDFSFRGGLLVGGEPPPTSVPEPGTLSLLTLGLGGLLWSRGRRRAAHAQEASASKASA
jgi:hypothetical protein